MRLAVLIQLGRHSLHLHHVGNLGHGSRGRLASAPAHQLHAGIAQHGHNEYHGDDIDHIKLTNALCFLFHSFLHTVTGTHAPRLILCGQRSENIV